MIEWLQFQLSLISVQSHCGESPSESVDPNSWTHRLFPSITKELLVHHQSEAVVDCINSPGAKKMLNLGVARRKTASGIRGTLSEGLSIAEFFLSSWQLKFAWNIERKMMIWSHLSYLLGPLPSQPPPFDHQSEECLAGLVKFIVISWVKLVGQASQSVESFGGCWPEPNKLCFEEWALRNF